MRNDRKNIRTTLLATTAVLLALGGPGLADEVKDLTNPDKSDFSISARGLSDMNPLYRVYTGLNGDGLFANGAFDIVRRYDSGMWVRLQGRDLGLPTAEASAAFEQQGDWKLKVFYSEMKKYSPYTLNTKVAGVGTGSLVLNQDFRSSGGLGPTSELTLERRGAAVSATKFLGQEFRVNFGFKAEEKEGAIMASSIGSTWNGARPGLNYGTMFFTPQPENYGHTQIDAGLDYFTRKLQLTLGYYGSIFTTRNKALNVTPGLNSLAAVACTAAACGGTAVPAGAYGIPWISLPLNNELHQFYFTGAYSFSGTTKSSFKISRSEGSQNDGFIPNYGSLQDLASYHRVNPPGVPYARGNTATSLNGRVITTSAAANFNSRLTKDLDVTASWRYEDRDDQTPQLLYFDSTASAEYPQGLKNDHESHTTNRGGLDFAYRLPADIRLSAGFEYFKKETPEAMREYVEENILKVDLRKSMTETLNGSVTYSHGERDGGKWELFDATSFPTATNVAAPLQFVDRKRDKVRVMVDWAPINALGLQAYYQYNKDTYPFVPVNRNARMGMTDGSWEMYGLDASYMIDKIWRATAFTSYNVYKTHQNELYTPRSLPQTCTTNAAATSCVPWQADLDMSGFTAGAGIKGAFDKLTVGADYLMSRDKTQYLIAFDPRFPSAAGSSVPAGAGVLPNTYYDLDRLRVYGIYPVLEHTRLRLDYVYDYRNLDNYTWTNWTFTDGTRVNVAPRQTTHIFGVTITQSF